MSPETNTGFPLLLVERDSAYRSQLLALLKQEGYQIRAVATLEDAVQQVAEGGVKLVLANFQAQGVELCTALRKLPSGAALYILLYATNRDADYLAKAFDAGCDDYVSAAATPELISRLRSGRHVVQLRRDIDRSRQEYDHLLEMVGVIVLKLDVDGTVALVNRQGCEVFGIERKVLLGRDWLDTCVLSEARDALRGMFMLARLDGQQLLNIFDVTIVRPGGEQHVVSWNFSPLYGDAGNVIGFLGVGEDVTAYRNAQRERQRLTNQLQQAQKTQALGNLIGGIAHNFNNSLATILGYAELAKDIYADVDGGQLAGFLGSIHQAGVEARDLVTALLNFSETPSSERNDLLLAPMLDDVLRMLRPLLTSSIDIRTDFSSDLPEIRVNTSQVHQMLMGLCINAREAMPDSGRIDIGLRRTHLKALSCASCQKSITGDFVELSVADTGRGMAPELLPRLFEPFFTTKEIGKATGLGLSTVHGMMHGYGGHILGESAPGKGTSFRLLFPVPA